MVLSEQFLQLYTRAAFMLTLGLHAGATSHCEWVVGVLNKSILGRSKYCAAVVVKASHYLGGDDRVSLLRPRLDVKLRPRLELEKRKDRVV